MACEDRSIYEPTGWTCPKCGTVMAPWVSYCLCCTYPLKDTVYSGEGTGNPIPNQPSSTCENKNQDTQGYGYEEIKNSI